MFQYVWGRKADVDHLRWRTTCVYGNLWKHLCITPIHGNFLSISITLNPSGMDGHCDVPLWFSSARCHFLIGTRNLISERVLITRYQPQILQNSPRLRLLVSFVATTGYNEALTHRWKNSLDNYSIAKIMSLTSPSRWQRRKLIVVYVIGISLFLSNRRLRWLTAIRCFHEKRLQVSVLTPYPHIIRVPQPESKR